MTRFRGLNRMQVLASNDTSPTENAQGCLLLGPMSIGLKRYSQNCIRWKDWIPFRTGGKSNTQWPAPSARIGVEGLGSGVNHRLEPCVVFWQDIKKAAPVGAASLLLVFVKCLVPPPALAARLCLLVHHLHGRVSLALRSDYFPRIDFHSTAGRNGPTSAATYKAALRVYRLWSSVGWSLQVAFAAPKQSKVATCYIFQTVAGDYSRDDVQIHNVS